MSAATVQKERLRPPAPDPDEIARHLDLVWALGTIIEFRALDVNLSNYESTWSGYYDSDHRDNLISEIMRLSPYAAGSYITLNPVLPACLARATNRMRKMKKTDPATNDKEILKRVWLLIDCDPVRPQGISASDAELGAAIQRRDDVNAYLRAEGWPEGINGMSGNGGHSLRKIDLPVEDGDILKQCLAALSAKFDDSTVKLDTKVFNPARITKIYGSPARKGDHVADRPHRIARITSAPDEVKAVPIELLRALASEAPSTTKPTAGPTSQPSGPQDRSQFNDVADFVAQHNLEILKGPDSYQDGRRWVIVCPWDSSHSDNAAWIVQFGSGKVAAGCQHNGCQGKNWGDLYRLFNPVAPPAPRPLHIVGAGKAQENKNTPPINDEGQRPASPGRRIREQVILSGDVWNTTVAICTALRKVMAASDVPILLNAHGMLGTINGEVGAREFRPLTIAGMGSVITEHVELLRIHETKEGVEYLPGKITRHDIDQLIETIRRLPELLPTAPLTGIVRLPFFVAGGRLLTRNGYDVPSGYYLDAGADLANLDICLNPTPVQIAGASDRLVVIANESKWKDQSSLANYLGALLTPAVLPFLPSHANVPHFLVNKPAPGSGATYSLQIIGAIYQGTGPEVHNTPPMENTDEWEKSFLGVLKKRIPVVIYDNVTEPVGNQVLYTAATTRRYSGRLLGGNEFGTFSVDALIAYTGNNIRPANDMVRRVFMSRIDTGLEHPEDREFERDPLAETIQDRRTIITAILTLIRAYFNAGCPTPSVGPFASYDLWAAAVGGVLHVAGISNFLENRRAMRTTADEEGIAHAEFLAAIAAWQPLGGFKTGALLTAVHDGLDNRLRGYNWKTPQLEEAAPVALRTLSGQKNLLKALGTALGDLLDRPRGGRVLRKIGNAGGSPTYEVQPMSDGSDGPA